MINDHSETLVIYSDIDLYYVIIIDTPWVNTSYDC